MCSSRCRVLIADNDTAVAKRLIETLSDFEIRWVQLHNENVITAFIDASTAFKPHVIIISLDFFMKCLITDETSLSFLKDRSEGVVTLLYAIDLSKSPPPNLTHKYDMTINMNRYDTLPSLVNAVKTAVHVRCYSRDLHWESLFQSPTTQAQVAHAFQDQRVAAHLLDDVMWQLLDEYAIQSLEIVGGVDSTGVPVRQFSVAYNARLDDGRRIFIKLAPREHNQLEIHNYYTYIHKKLGSENYAKLEKTTDFWVVGGLVCEFLGTSYEPFPTFTTHFHTNHQIVTIVKPLEYFFFTIWMPHFRAASRRNDVDLYMTYSEALLLEKRLLTLGLKNPFLASIMRRFDYDLDAFHVFVSTRMPTDQIDFSVVHGDLHGNNLLVDNMGCAWIIDYERIEESHILRDIAQLHGFLVTHFIPPELSQAQIYDVMMQSLLSHNAKIPPSLKHQSYESRNTIRKLLGVTSWLQQAAKRISPKHTYEEYLVALLVDGLFIVTIKSLSDYQRQIGSTLALTTINTLQDRQPI